MRLRGSLQQSRRNNFGGSTLGCTDEEVRKDLVHHSQVEEKSVCLRIQNLELRSLFVIYKPGKSIFSGARRRQEDAASTLIASPPKRDAHSFTDVLTVARIFPGRNGRFLSNLSSCENHRIAITRATCRNRSTQQNETFFSHIDEIWCILRGAAMFEPFSRFVICPANCGKLRMYMVACFVKQIY